MRKKFGKKLFSLFVALLMVVTTFPVTALSATEEEHDCAVCNGSGVIECAECENGQIDVICSVCSGSGLVTADCNVCSATGYLEVTCSTCTGTGLNGETQCSDCSGNGIVQIPCDNCNATGSIETTCERCNGNKVVKEDCAVCSATGEVECTTCAGTGKISREYEICPDCDGTGECNMCAGAGVLEQNCSVCNGTKIVDCEDCVAGEVRTVCDICNGTGNVTVKSPCVTCAATGMLDGVVCPDCNGTKEIESAEDCSECENGYVISVCTNCGGTGTIDCSNCENGKEEITCTQCNGTKKCARCLGTGKIYTTQDSSFAFSDPNPQPIEVGDTYQNVATSTNNVSGEIKYSVDDDSIATVSDDGTVTALRVGTVVVTASIATDYTYSSAKVSYNLSIEKGNPEISDIYATEITYGQTLADSTLSAKATLGGKNISGKIEWKNSEIKPVVNDSNTTEYDCVFTPDDQDNYNPVDCKATLNIKQASINPIITPYQGAYDKESHDALEISGILDTDTITYFVDGVQVDSMPTVKDVSDNEKEITVKIKRNENYIDFEGTYSCLITRIDIDAEIQNPVLVYTGEEQDALTITNNSGDEITSVTYTPKELQDGELSISNDGKVKNAGVYRYEVTLVINNNYNEKVVFPVITTVAQADPELEITNDPEKTYKYEKNQKIQINTEKSALTTADVTYKVDNDEVATISDTGELSILQPGNVTVTASIEETDNCKADEATITITISPGDYTPAFENGDQVTLTYGAQTEYVNALDVDSVKSSGEISYSIEPVNSELVASFDTTTGKIVFADGVQSGSLTVTANIAADEYYNAQEISYKLEVMPLETPDNAYTVDTSINDNGWIYTSPVQISAAEDYQISKQCSFAAENWSDSITFDTIDGTNEFKFYIRDSSGKITSVITESQNVDCTAPQDLTITFSDTAITKVLEGITFGFYNSNNKKLSVMLKASDATSGLEKFVYCYDGKNDIEIVPDENGECTFTIESEYKGQVNFTAYDKAGNFASFDSKNNKTVQGAINDLTAPEGTVAYSEPANTVGGLRYYSVAPELTFTIDEEYFFSTYELSDETVSTLDKNVGLNITKDGEEYYTGSAVPEDENANLFTAELDEDAKTISVVIPSVLDEKANDGVYAVKLLYSDLSGNSFEIESENFVIDTTAPIVTVSYDNNTVNENAKDDTFFDKARTATITVEEHNFDAESIVAQITAKDIAGEDIEAAEAVAMLADLEWNSEGDTHTATIKYSDDAWYTFALTSFKDYALNEMNPDNENKVIYADETVSPEQFVVDKEIAKVEISTEKPLAYKILDGITFGFFGKSTVTITVEDATSGMQKLTYESLKTANSKGDYRGEITIEEMDSTVINEGYQVSKYEFTIDDEYKDSIEATVLDNSGNESSTQLINEDSDEYNGIIVDTTDPVFSEISYNAINEVQEENQTKYYYAESAKVVFAVDEEYFYANYYDSAVSANSEENPINALSNDVTLEITKNGDPYYTGSAVPEEEKANLFTAQLNENAGTITVTIPSVLEGQANDGDFVVTVSYTDLSDHTASVTTDILVIDTTAPVVTVSYDNNTVNENAKDDTFFDKARTATITVEEHNFDAESIVAQITAKDIAGEDIEAAEAVAMLADLEWNSEGDTHTATIKYSDDAWYTFALTSFKDYALNEMNPDNENKVIYSDKTVSSEKFVIDTVSPSNDVSYTFTNQYDSSLKKVLNVLTFGVFFNGNIEIKVSAQDMTSGLYKAKLYIKSVSDDADVSNMKITGLGSNGQDNYDEFVLTENDNTKGDTTFTVDARELDEFRGQLYIEIYDKSGNLYRNNSDDTNIVDGKITVNNQVIDNNVNSIDNIEQYESSEYHKETSSIVIRYSNEVESTVNQASPAKDEAVKLINGKISSLADEDQHMCASNVPLFNTNVPLNISVTDNSSGISMLDIMIFDANEDREIATYKTVIRSDGEIESNTTKKFSFASAGSWNLEQNEYGLTVSANRNITVSANYNDIVVLVQLTDNAGNVSYDYYQFGIDKTSPSVSAAFNDLSNAQNGSYYREKRTLTVTVKERDFTHSGKSVIFTYKYQGETKSYIINSNKFKAVDSTPIYNDSKSYTFTIDKFTQDGEYADFKFEIEDRVGNSTNADKSVIRSSNNNMFRYDHIAPVITIASDRHGQNSNTKFYQDSRVITVTVRDRYATNSKAQSYIVRRVSNLTDFSFADSEANQRYHTASRILTYTFTFRTNTSIDCALLLNTISDLAGNRVSNVPNITNGADFVIDGRIPQSFSATITEDGKSGVNVLNQSDYKVFVGDDITLTITCEDENLRYANISDVRLVCAALTSSGRTEEHVFELNKVSSQSSRNRITYSINNLDYDGFYDLSFTVTDDSGKQSSVQNIRFAISRNGALFASKDIESIQNHGAYNIDSISDIAFNQYSAQRNTKATLYISSKNGSLGFKGRTLVEGVDYVISGGNLLDSDLNCYRSIYRLTKNAFMMDDGRILDGVYLITITPDNTSSENGQRSVNAQSTSFEVTIDATNPVISDVNTSYTTSYGSDENYEFKQDDNKTLFTDTINLEFNVSDTFSGINENTVSVTWGEETEKRQVTKNENGNYSIKLNSDDAQNGNTVNISVEDKAGNSINYSFELNLNNNFWIYIVIAAFCLIALIIVMALVIKSKNSKKD